MIRVVRDGDAVAVQLSEDVTMVFALAAQSVLFAGEGDEEAGEEAAKELLDNFGLPVLRAHLEALTDAMLAAGCS